MIKFFSLAVFIFSFSSHAEDFCAQLDKQASIQGTKMDNTDNIYQVAGKGHLYFYSAPDKKCLIKKTFIIPGDFVYTYIEYNGYYSVMYMAKEDRQVSGWVEKSRLVETGKGVGPDYNHSEN